MKEGIFILTLTALLLLSGVVLVPCVKLVRASGVQKAYAKIELESPQNITYNINTIFLNISAETNLEYSFFYSVDGQEMEPLENMTIISREIMNPGFNPQIFRTILNCSVVVSNLSEGWHNITAWQVNPAVSQINKVSFVVAEFLIDTTPIIHIDSPQNKTYVTDSVSLIFTVDEETSWVGYSLDGQAQVTLTDKMLNLTGLSDGSHSITVYANDTAGNTATPQTVHFTIETAPTWTTTATAIIIVAITGAALLIVYTKTRKTKKDRTY